MTVVLVLNAGSSSVKWQLVDGQSGASIRGGLVERLDTDRREAAGHDAAIQDLLAKLRDEPVAVIGHRVVHGGSRFDSATLITDEVEQQIDELAALAPLHNPVNLAGIRAARAVFPGIPNVAVFDTAFHRTLPPAATVYALPPELVRQHRIRRYGFHGISYQYVSTRAAELLGRPLSELRLIVFHLGNGASACAIAGGRSVDTSMGMTPLAGLVMGTRAGDVDPGVLIALGRAGLGWDALEELLTRESGLRALAGTEDMRDIHAAAVAGDPVATAALEVYHHRLRHYLGAYLAQLGGADAIVFTGGVGENAPATRAAAVAGMEGLGIRLDDERNRATAGREARTISDSRSRTAVLVVPTDEELEIARQSLAAVTRPDADPAGPV
ncbi:MAG: acetate kinase [Micrococcales bacterium]|nr:acetate kinase [Micrococcales bacterium]OJX69339.1 MAG: acetate kinase [Micrococcales bacterium 72-143]